MKRLSIRSLLFALVLAVALPLIGLQAYTAYRHATVDVTRARAMSLNVAQVVAAYTEQFIADSAAVLAHVAERPLVRAMDPGRCDPIFAELLALNPAFTNIGLIDLDGRVICSAAPLPGGQPVSVADMAWFQNAKRAGQFRVGELHVGPITGKWVSALTQPVRDEAGNLVGVLAMTIDLARYQSVFAGVNLLPGSVITILDAKGAVIARAPDPEKWVGRDLRGAEIVDLVITRREGQGQARGVDGVERAYGFTTISIANWHAYAGIPIEVIYAPVREASIRSALIALAALALAAALGYWLSQRIARPVIALADVARAVARGEETARAAPAGVAEMVEVAAEFNRMVDGLREANRRIAEALERADVEIAERRRAEGELLRRNRTLRMLSQANQALIRIAQEAELLKTICRIVVEEGGYRMAWVGIADQDDAKRVRPVAQFGFEEGYLDAVKVSWADDEHGRGPTGAAIRTGAPVIARNIPDDPGYAPWRAAATQRGYASSIALPLLADSQAFGALSVYAAEPDAFDEDEVKLLSELASDLAYGLCTLHDRRALHESEARYRQLFAASPDALFILDADGRLLDCNDVAVNCYGYKREELLQMTARDLAAPDLRDQASARIKQALETGATFEWRHQRKDGSELPVEISAQPITLGGKRCILSSVRDITERRRAEAALRASEEKFARAFRNSPDIIVLTSLADGRIVEVNDSLERATGYTHAEVVGKTTTEVPFWADPADRQRYIELLLRDGRARDLEVRFRIKSGEVRDTLLSGEIIELSDSKYILGVIRDITERKRMEQTLRESEASLRAIFENTLQSFLLIDRDYKIRAFNKIADERARLIYGRGLRPGDSFFEFITETEREDFIRNFRRALAGEKVRIERKIRNPDGQGFWFEFHYSPVYDETGTATGIFFTVTDIDERKRAEEMLVRTERIYREAITQAGGVPYQRDYGSDRYVFMGEEILKLTGYTAEEMTGPLFTSRLRRVEAYGPDKDIPHMERVRRARLGLIKEWHEDYLFERKDGTLVWLTDHSLPVYDASGKMTGSLGILMDITERKRAEEALQQKSRDLAVLLEISQALATTLEMETVLQLIVERAISVVDLDSGAIYLLQGEELYLRATTPPLPPEFPEEFRYASLADHPHIHQAIVSGAPVILSDTTTADLTPAERSISEARGLRSLLYLPLLAKERAVGVLIVGTVARTKYFSESEVDLYRTLSNQAALAIENARLYEQVQRHAAELEQRVAERTAELAAKNKELETFAYSVSHDLKAPLRGIDGYSSLLLRDHADRLDEEGKRFLTRIRAAATRMGQLVDDLLAYSRLERRAFTVSETPLLPIIQAVVAERAADIEGRGVKLSVDTPQTTVLAEPAGLMQALRNLLDNALKFTRDAVQPTIEIGGRETEKSCILWVRDNGPGFDMGYHDRIFEIFQRLYRAEEYPGTGIGLAIVRKAMERMGGRVWAESAPGQGATFFLEIPR